MSDEKYAVYQGGISIKKVLVDETHIIDTYLIVLYCVAALLESGFLSVDLGVAVKAHHDAVFGAGCVVECEVCFVVQTCFTNWAETIFVLVPSCFFFFVLLKRHCVKCCRCPVVA